MEPKVVAVTFCRDEQLTIRKCVESVLKQTVKPSCYVVVDDNSTDTTPVILKQFEDQIEIISLARHHPYDRQGYHTAVLFLTATHRATKIVPDWDFLLKVDGDHELFDKKYVERLIAEMNRNPKLGMVSGLPISKMKHGYVDLYVNEATPKHFAWDGAKLYRRACFEQIKPIDPAYGWDTSAEIKAQVNGWKIKTLRYPKFLDTRPSIQERHYLNEWIEIGKDRSHLGFPFLNHLMATLMRFRRRPLILGGIGFFLSYVIHRVTVKRRFSKKYYEIVKHHIFEENRARMKKKRVQKYFIRCLR